MSPEAQHLGSGDDSVNINTLIMQNRITAQQANSISISEYGKIMSLKIEKFLNELYTKIRKSSEMGKFNTSLDINLSDDYRKRITEVLESDGYTVRYNHNYYDYITVSWKTPTH